MLLEEHIKSISSEEHAVAVSRKVLSESNLDCTLKLDCVYYLRGKQKN